MPSQARHAPKNSPTRYWLVAGPQVLAHADAVAGFQVGIDILQTLTLTNGVEDQHHVALASEPLSEALIRLDALPFAEWPQLPTTPGSGSLRFVGTYRLAVTGKFGPTFEDDLLNAIRVALDDTGNAGVERRPLRLGPNDWRTRSWTERT